MAGGGTVGIGDINKMKDVGWITSSDSYSSKSEFFIFSGVIVKRTHIYLGWSYHNYFCNQ